MYSCTTCRLNSTLCERCCLAMAFILRKPRTSCQITNCNLSGSRGALQRHVCFVPNPDMVCVSIAKKKQPEGGSQLKMITVDQAVMNECNIPSGLRLSLKKRFQA